MNTLLRIIYAIVTWLLVPVALAHLYWKGFGNPAYWRRIGERFGSYAAPRLQDVIWVHAVSVGEVQAAAALVGKLMERYPASQVLITTTTPTGSDRVRALFGDRVAHCYAPLDLQWSVRRFFNWCRPRVAIIMETEIWPNLYRECGARKVPLVLASARVSPKSIGRYRTLVSLFAETLSHGIVIAAQTAADAQRFVSLGASSERTHVTGNIKFDFTLPAGMAEKGAELRAQHTGDRPVWIAASTHAGEEEIILQAHRRIQKIYANALLILVPRHPERFDGIAALVEKQGMRSVRRSSGYRCAPDTEVLLGDTMGELMYFYTASDVAFVGGSLVEIGGHNLLEPAALKLPMITGPHTYNSEEIADLLRLKGVAPVVHDADELAAAVQELLADPGLCERRGKLAKDLIDSSRGALARLLELLEPLLA